MTTVSSRDYAGPADLRAMQVLAQRLWSRASYHHVGDLAWQRFEHLGREPAWRTRIWRDGEAVVGWAWLVEAGHFYFQVDPAYSVLFDEVFDWIEAASDASALSTGVLENQPDLIAALQRRGYQAGSDAYPFNLKTARTLERLPPLVLPEGYRAASMAELGDPDARALARNVMAAWPYRSDLDWVIVAPDGRWAANCCIWLDGANQVGELEPVGTDADFRRLGLGRGVCIAALQALRETGADQAIVTCRGDEAYPAPRKLYFELGFETYTRSYVYRRKRLA